jgi:predicted aminopeptidase
MEVVSKRVPLDEVVESPATPEPLRERLRTIRRMRDFASSELALPNNGSYRSYADLGRPFVVWNVFASPELSLEPMEWCYPLVGCLSYRGYFERDQAVQLAAELDGRGMEAWVGGVPAYSTLGWFDDPLLNTFVAWPEGRLAELIFHELAHQRLYLGGETEFNESFATAVGRLGAERWLAAQGSTEAMRTYRHTQARKQSFLALVREAKYSLQQIYEADLSEAAKRDAKAEVLNGLSDNYQRWKSDWQGYGGYDSVMALGPPNGWFTALATYHHLVPAFNALFVESGEDFETFYETVERLAEMDAETRAAELAQARQRQVPSRRASR